jgi:hypothetical protein
MGSSSAPMAYTPANQAGADSSYMSTLNTLTAGNTANYNTANTGYNAGYQAQANNPYAASAQSGVNTAAAAGMAAGQTDFKNSATLDSLAPAIQAYGFDPNSQQYNYNLNQTQQQAAANNAQAGVAGSPFGTGLVNDATTNFNMDWQSQQAGKSQQATAALSALFNASGALGVQGGSQMAASAVAPSQNYTNNNDSIMAALNNLVKGMGAASSPLTSDVAQYGNYLNIGQNATQSQDQATQINNAQPGALGAIASLLGGGPGGLGKYLSGGGSGGSGSSGGGGSSTINTGGGSWSDALMFV